MFKLVSLALVALAAASAVNGAVVFPRKNPPAGWITPILEVSLLSLARSSIHSHTLLSHMMTITLVTSLSVARPNTIPSSSRIAAIP